MKISTVSQMQALDRAAVETFGIPEVVLMENAGLAVYAVMARCLPVEGRTFLVFCGLGNNGGDGFVVARKLHSNGAQVKVFVLGDPARFRGVAKLNLDMLAGLPIKIQTISATKEIALDLAHCHAVVDAIFGTGLARSVTGIYAQVITAINTSGKTVFSVDIPSGVHGDSGAIMGCAVQAAATVTFGLPKIGSLLYPGYACCGDLTVSHISFPRQLYTADIFKLAFNAPIELPPRNPDGHKGSFGQALFVAGASAYFGAPYFAALSFLKAGGGYSRLAAPRAMTPFIAAKAAEIVFMPMAETPAGAISMDNCRELVEMAAKMDMVVLGPGLSLEAGVQELVRELAVAIETPLVIDGDAITALSGNLDILRRRSAPTVLTPHLGEMARITGLTRTEIRADRSAVVRHTAESIGAVVVLKGAHSLIALPDGRVFVNMSGNAGMATAGSGDVLTGAIAAMAGLGLPVETAVRNGVFVHGLAGDLAADERGEDGLTAQDILECLPFALQRLRETRNPDFVARYGGLPVV